MNRPWDLSEFEWVEVFGPCRVGILDQFNVVGIKYRIRGRLFGQVDQIPEGDDGEWALLTSLIPTSRIVLGRLTGKWAWAWVLRSNALRLFGDAAFRVRWWIANHTPNDTQKADSD